MDWDDAYANGPHIANAESYPPRWDAAAAAFRAARRFDTLRYGPHPRQQLDLFFPHGEPEGLMVFVHGGYWLKFDRRSWSHLAAGALARRYAVALPSYPLAPEVGIPQITRSIAKAVQLAADAVPGPVRLAGHSAGGHLVARMACGDVDLACRDRIAHIVPISPVGDLRPLMKTAMGPDLHLTDAVCAAESPTLLPAPDRPVTVWVGSDERPVFLDQARWLADAWNCGLEVEIGRHHFDVIDGLASQDHILNRTLFS